MHLKIHDHCERLFIHNHVLQETYLLIHTKLIPSEFQCRKCCLRLSVNDLFVKKKNLGYIILALCVFMPRHHVKETERLSTLTSTCIRKKLFLQHRKGEKNGKLFLYTKLHMFIKTDMKNKR